MSSRKRRTLTLQEATEYANEHGLIGGDYYGFNDDDVSALRNLYERTKWRQSLTSQQRGIGIIRAFYYALRRRAPKRRGIISEKQVSQAYELRASAERVWSDAVNGASDSRSGYERAALKYEMAGEAFEAVGEMREAVQARRLSAQILRTADLNFPPSRDRSQRSRRYR